MLVLCKGLHKPFGDLGCWSSLRLGRASGYCTSKMTDTVSLMRLHCCGGLFTDALSYFRA